MSSVLAIGVKGEKFMKKKTTYDKAPNDISEAILSSKRIDDFLPPPESLVKKEETVKIAISLSKKSVDFFKEQAKKAGVPYQTMIKNLLDYYTAHYK